MDAVAAPRLIARPLRFMRRFLETEAAGGIVLMGVTVLALVCANSALAPTYFALLEVSIGIRVGGAELVETLLHWVNDGLMAVFFLLVGLEIKREILDGQLSTPRRLALPGLAAVGGMAVPALIYVALNGNDPAALRGWAIPAATDIAFALGILSLLGSRVPVSLKVFLTALAILDDLGAVAIIALFYTADLSVNALALAGFGLAVLVLLNRAGVTRLTPYMLIGAAVWVCVLKSGIHATLAGVALAFTIPFRASTRDGDDWTSPLHRLEHRLHGLVAYMIVPVFGFANAGVSFEEVTWAALFDPLPLGIAAGLFVGKQVGVFLSAWAAIRFGIAEAPEEASMPQLYGASILCGIGFTMSLFIGALAFGSGEPATATKIGVFSGSLLSAVVGYAFLRVVSKQQ